MLLSLQNYAYKYTLYFISLALSAATWQLPNHIIRAIRDAEDALYLLK